MSIQEKEFIITCPHCKEFIIIQEINCGIFRHGTFHDGNQIEPHASKEHCDAYANQKIIYGCGKPFQIVKKDDQSFEAIVCDYI
jgi:hypothetical protein